MNNSPLWQHPDFPSFYWNEAAIAPFEQDFRKEIKNLRAELQGITLSASDLLTEEILANSLIEGIPLDRESVHSSFLHNLLPKKNPEKGAVTLSNLALGRLQDPLSHDFLFQLHRLLLADSDFPPEAIGNYVGDMSIVLNKRLDREPQILHQGIDKEQVTAAMTTFLHHFNQSSQDQVLAKVIRDHIHFEILHPFCDGNGRIGRALMQRALSHHLSLPVPLAISRVFQANRELYYRQFQTSLDLTPTLKIVAPLLIQSVSETRHILALTAYRTRVADAKDTLNPRQSKVLHRLIDAELQGGFEGGLSNANYQTIASTSDRTALRDLNELVTQTFLKKTGERKGTRYWIEF